MRLSPPIAFTNPERSNELVSPLVMRSFLVDIRNLPLHTSERSLMTGEHSGSDAVPATHRLFPFIRDVGPDILSRGRALRFADFVAFACISRQEFVAIGFRQRLPR